MATTHYGDETAVRTWLKAFDDNEQLTDELLEEALTAADDFINSESLKGLSRILREISWNGDSMKA